MDSDRQQCADQILEAIEYGQLSKEEIERRLNQIINDELSAPEDTGYDAAKVELCNSLLWQLQTHGQIHLQSPSEKAKEKVKMDYSSHKRKVALIRRSIYAAASILIILVGLTVLDVISPIQWFTRQSVNDEQQFIVEGHSISVNALTKAIAEHQTNGSSSLSTSSYSELVGFLGFDPGIPEMISDGFDITDYQVLVRAQYIKICCQYGNEPSIVLWMTLYKDVDQAYTQFEQDADGYVIVINDVKVYKYTNAGRVSYLWISNNTLFKLSSDDPESINDEIVQSFLRRYR